jgi:hypothetical protein
MNRLSDWKWASFSALVLTGTAVILLFLARPSQIGWLFALLPGAIAGAPVSDLAYRNVRWSDQVVLWTLTVGISLLWYFAISYMTIKFWRLASGAWRNRKQ